MTNQSSVILSNRRDSPPGLLGLKNATLLLAVTMLLHVTGARDAGTAIGATAVQDPQPRKLAADDLTAEST
jgi:hypothetical protein